MPNNRIAEGNYVTGISRSQSVSTKQQQIAELARKAPGMSFTSLNHHMDMDWLREAYRRTRKDGATGIDGQTATDYAADLEENLRSLLERAKSGSYFAPPVRRVNIPKGPGSKEPRPLGITTFEDKILQRAVVMLLEPIYEQDFLDCSYGYRPKRSAHTMLENLWQWTMTVGGGWIVEIDIRKYFDSIDRSHLRNLLDLRVRDGVVRRLIGKWLNAGVAEGGSISYPEAGTPQGSVASPLLSNVFLHYVLDVWFEREVKPRLRGRAQLFRYADDATLVFSDKEDALRVMAVLPKRFEGFGLVLHPEKTRLVTFLRPQGSSRNKDSSQTFDFVGFTHYWGKTRKGGWAVKRKTAKNRLSRAIASTADWCRRNRHHPIVDQQVHLNQKLHGHYAYYGITGNMRSLQKFQHEVAAVWHKWLERRSQRGRMTWERFNLLLARYPLASARVVKSIYAT